MTALQKPGGGVRGIVAGDVVRRLVARTISQQLSSAVESATAPFQYALSTRAGCECVAHALQASGEVDERATIMSIDGTRAHDLISRRAMLSGLAQIEGGREVPPFVKLFYGAPSQYWWEDEAGVVLEIDQGEGGEQRHAMMPLLFSLGQYNALHAVQERMLSNERLFAFLDDVCVVCLSDRVAAIHMLLVFALWVHGRIRVHAGKTKIYNCAGEKPEACGHLERIARTVLEDARVWRGGAEIPEVERCIKVLGTPLGHPAFVQHQLARVRALQQVLLDRILAIQDVQSAWALLSYCAVARATYFISRSHDSALWECMCRVLGVPPESCESFARAASQLPLAFGGLGLRSAERTRTAASWADSLSMIHQRQPLPSRCGDDRGRDGWRICVCSLEGRICCSGGVGSSSWVRSARIVGTRQGSSPCTQKCGGIRAR